ncbi:succinyl-diaminopimelate desuccinylase [Aequitasia blattaphilus]|uniref:M20 family metallopeptidase n=1 Tax=Aequitasia blattaphilus TaxID=2949332 RepID=A0ABT1E7Y1_9FIRM|nr:M20 family metallopeptidase [Aequitasia blattaphilus]MCP1101937.1 M20 family metallopeptidase [Aequitasia blattaphilus]MCR8614577.1 M20 family metallopeptidase [Aequitasia blattaphilus]
MVNERIRLLLDLLEIPSVNGQGGEIKKAEYLMQYFKDHGIDSKIQIIDEKRGNVLARIKGRDSSKTMVLNGHIDTVPYGDLKSWETDPQTPVLKDGKLYARGACDMQSGLAALTYALTHLEKEPAFDLLFIGTCDEEKGGAGASKLLEEQIIPTNAEIILIGEPTNLNVGVVQKGCLWLSCTFHGKASHGAYPKEGRNAIEDAYKFAFGISEYVKGFSHPLAGESTAQITEITGGIAQNITPDLCEMTMDIRMVPGLTEEMVLKEASLYGNEKEITVEIINSREAVEIEPGNTFLKSLKEEVQGSKVSCDNIGTAYFTDGSILKGENRKVLLFGPGDPKLCHQPNECVSLDEYEKAIMILQNFLIKEKEKTQ